MVKLVTIRKRCGKCKKGELEYTNFTLTSNPPLYVHQCNSCYESFNKRGIYPSTFAEYSKEETKEVWEDE